jgi:hypothetical protein
MSDEQRINYAVCAKHNKMLEEMHLALCGNEVLGVKGVVAELREVKADVDILKNAKSNTISVGKSFALVGSFILGVCLIAAALVAVADFLKGK